MVPSLLRPLSVMPGLVPGIHIRCTGSKDVDTRDKPGHDEKGGRLEGWPRHSPSRVLPYAI